ncbi:tyrosine-protein kinase JAK2-like [Tachysurus ichikawai]
MESSTHTHTPCPDPLKPACGAALQVHLYYCSQSTSSTSSSTLSYLPGDYIAEELCIKAAKECGKLFPPGFLKCTLIVWR